MNEIHGLLKYKFGQLYTKANNVCKINLKYALHYQAYMRKDLVLAESIKQTQIESILYSKFTIDNIYEDRKNAFVEFNFMTNDLDFDKKKDTLAQIKNGELFKSLIDMNNIFLSKLYAVSDSGDITKIEEVKSKVPTKTINEVIKRRKKIDHVSDNYTRLRLADDTPDITEGEEITVYNICCDDTKNKNNFRVHSYINNQKITCVLSDNAMISELELKKKMTASQHFEMPVKIKANVVRENGSADIQRLIILDITETADNI